MERKAGILDKEVRRQYNYGGRWKPNEIEILKKHWKNTPREEIERLLSKRTWKAISNKSEKLGIYRNYRQIYKKVEDNKIIEAWQRVNSGEPIYKICKDYNITDVHLFHLLVEKFGRERVDDVVRKNRTIKNRERSVKFEDINERVVREIFEKYKASYSDIHTFARDNKLYLKQQLGWYGSNTLLKMFHYFFFDEFILHRENRASFTYQRGRHFEYRVRDYFKKIGYLVWRSPASRSKIDLLALKKGEILFIQCKICYGIKKEERKEIVSLAESIGAFPILAYREGKKIKFVDLRNMCVWNQYS